MEEDVCGMAHQICNTANEILAVAQKKGHEATLLGGFLIRSQQMNCFLEKQRFKDAIDLAMQLVLEIAHYEKQNNYASEN